MGERTADSSTTSFGLFCSTLRATLLKDAILTPEFRTRALDHGLMAKGGGRHAPRKLELPHRSGDAGDVAGQTCMWGETRRNFPSMTNHGAAQHARK